MNGHSRMINGHGPKYEDRDRISVLIVGAGIGGLMCALECWRKGFQVRIIEKSDEEKLIGDSLTLGPSAILAMEQNWPELFQNVSMFSGDPMIAYYKHTGEKILGPMSFEWSPSGEKPEKEPSRMFRVSRPELHQALSEQIERCGLRIEYGKPAVDYSEDLTSRKGKVRLVNGENLEADVVIAADGVHTKSWKLIGGERPAAQSSGHSIYRTAYALEHMLKDKEVAQRFKLQPDGREIIELWHGPGLHGIMVRTKNHFSWALTHIDKGLAEESWTNRVDPMEAAKDIEDIKDWDPLFVRAMKTCPKDALVDFKLMFRDPQPQWTSPGGFVLSLGDAAHSFLPSSGNGGTQAVEDAVSIATCLQLAGKSNIPFATRIHSKLRFERCSCLQMLGFYNKGNRDQTDWEAIKKNPALITPKFGKWIWSHDAESYAYENYGKAFNHLVNGAPFENSNIPPGYTYKPWTLADMMKLEKEGKQVELEGEWF